MDFTLTPAARKFIGLMLRLSGRAGSGFRLSVSAGGCSGLVAQFNVEAAPHAGDAVFETGGLKFFLPAESRLLLDGVTIDFADTAAQSGLVFHDPKSAGCGCKATDAAAPQPLGGVHAH